MKSDEIRQKFLSFFKDRGHAIFPSASLIPTDPGVLLTMAGMLPFKPFFLGTERAPAPRITSIQKCVRTSDIEQVGNTTRHHTFFEMLGNFSFGDYFKREAILWGYEWLTKIVNLDSKRIWVAVFKDDDEAFNIWQKDVGVPTEKIFRLDEENNFWYAGPTGPCGPCSEIYWDIGEKFGCEKPTCGPGCDCERFLEIWNLVFMQHDRDASGKLTPLPKKNVDTGMGLERIASVLQGVASNFETDLLSPIYRHTVELANKDAAEKDRVRALRIIADHVRAAVFLLGDGVIPANDGRGYILRRLIRRAVDQGEKIGIQQIPFLPFLSRAVFELAKNHYPDLLIHRHLIEQYLETEERKFRETLADGNLVMDKFMAIGQVSGRDVVKIFTTYGIPLETIQEKFQEAGLRVKADEIPAALEEEKEKSRRGGVGKRAAPPPQGGHASSQFVGYETLEVKDARIIDIVDPGLWLVLDATPFYPEGGGQVGDTGMIETQGTFVRIIDTQGSMSGTIYHLLESREGLKKGDTVRVVVDKARRERIRNHHSATHLIHKALKVVLGEHAKQAGSLVAPDRLRFDFSHPSAIPLDVLQKVEDIVNEKIATGLKGEPRVVPFQKAVEEGAVAMFGEKYGDQVRMVTFNTFSKELCGGTHVHNTRDIGLVKITGESAISSGMRRIEAVAGPAIADYYEQRIAVISGELQKQRDKLEILQARTGRKVTIGQSFAGSIEPAKQDEIRAWETELRVLLSEKEQVQKIVQQLEAEELKIRTSEALNELALEQTEKNFKIRNVPPFRIGYAYLAQHRPEVLRACADTARDKIQSGGVLINSGESGNVTVTIAFTKDAVQRGLHAGNILKRLLAKSGGRGGGRPEIAQGGSLEYVSMDDFRNVVNQELPKIS